MCGFLKARVKAPKPKAEPSLLEIEGKEEGEVKMKKAAAFLSLIFLFSFFSGCPVKEDPPSPFPALSEPESPAASQRGIGIEADAASIEELEPDPSDPVPGSIVKDYLRMDHEGFSSLYSEDTAFQHGFIYNNSDDWNAQYAYGMSGPGWLYPLKFWKRAQDPIIGSVNVGDGIEAIAEEFGSPDFYDPELEMRAYRFSNFYLALKGEKQAEEVLIVKIPRLPDAYQNILDAFIEGMDILELKDAYPAYTGYYPGASVATLDYPCGITFQLDGQLTATVYQNYRGSRYEDPGPVSYTGKDYFFQYLCAQLRRQLERENGEWIPSPDGSVSIRQEKAGPYADGSGIAVRFNDGSAPGFSFPAGNTLTIGPWLNNRFFLYSPGDTSKQPPAVYDIRKREPAPITELAGWQPEGDGYRCEVDGNTVTLTQAQPEKTFRSQFYSDTDGGLHFYDASKLFPMPVRQPGMDGMETFMDGFITYSPFPEFERAQAINPNDSSLLLNLFGIAVRCNDTLLAHGRGVTQEQRAGFEREASEAGISSSFFARLGDMEEIGKYFFGGQFHLPGKLDSKSLLPLQGHSDIYYCAFLDGPPFTQIAMPFEATEKDGVITAKFYSLADLRGIEAYALCGATYQFIGEFIPKDDNAQEDDPRAVFQRLLLTVPLEQLDVLAVTFVREDGRLIAANARYNEASFAPDSIDDPLAWELASLAHVFSAEYMLAEFTSLSELDVSSAQVSSNLFALALRNRDKTIGQDGGLTQEQREILLSENPFRVRHQDMEQIGKAFFGKEFVLPQASFEECAPSPGYPGFYEITGRGGKLPVHYYPAAISTLETGISVRLIPFTLEYSWDTGQATGIVLGRIKGSPGKHVQIIGSLRLSDKELESLPADAGNLLPYLRLAVPQEELYTLDVVFHQEDGRYVIASCQAGGHPKGTS